MDWSAVWRLGLLYGHLLLCVFALHRVLVTDWQLLHSRVTATELDSVHRAVVVLLAGLWLSGLGIVFIDGAAPGYDIAAHPKLLAKFTCVTVLTLNGLLLRRWCFPRLHGRRSLSRLEAAAVMACGAVSTTSWLFSAFYGIARTLQGWPLAATLAPYLSAMAAAVLAAMVLSPALRIGERVRRSRRSTPTAPSAVRAR